MNNTSCIVAVDFTCHMSRLLGTTHVTYNIKFKHEIASNILIFFIKTHFCDNCSFRTLKPLSMYQLRKHYDITSCYCIPGL